MGGPLGPRHLAEVGNRHVSEPIKKQIFVVAGSCIGGRHTKEIYELLRALPRGIELIEVERLLVDE